jgi:hypothetical protein
MVGEKKIRSKANLPADIQKLVNEVKANNKRIRSINEKCRKLKEEELYSEIFDSLKEAKAKLYDYVVENELDNIEEYSKGWLAPASVKKEERQEKKEEKIRSVTTSLLPTIGEDELEELVEKLTV